MRCLVTGYLLFCAFCVLYALCGGAPTSRDVPGMTVPGKGSR